MTTPKGSRTPPFRLNNGPVSADIESMSTAPRILVRHTAALAANPAAVLVLDLADGAVDVEPAPSAQVWTSPTLLVLATHDDVLAATARVARAVNVLDAATEVLNDQLGELAAAGEIPTAEEVAAVLAELGQYETELATVIPFRGGGAA